MPLSGLEHNEIVDLAVKAEKAQRRRQYKAAILGGLVAALLIFLLALYGNWELHNLLEASRMEAERDANSAEFQRLEQERLLEKIEHQLVPRAEFTTIERQLAHQKRQLRHQKRLLEQQKRQLRRIERSVVARGGG